MLELIRKFLEGIFGFRSEDDLDEGSFVSTPTPDIPPKPTPTPPSSPEKTHEVPEIESLEDPNELPAHMIQISDEELPPEVLPPQADSSERDFGPMEVQPKFMWCLDNGHGRLQAGKRSPVWSDGSQLEEWRFNRVIVKLIIEKLKPLGVKFFEVVPEEEVDAFLAGRIGRANSLEVEDDLTKIYVSVHGNGAQDIPQATGLETWFHMNSTSGKRIASVFQRHLMQHLNTGTHRWRDRGIRFIKPARRDFAVLLKTAMPAIITENGFYTNEKECRQMMEPEVQERMAKPT